MIKDSSSRACEICGEDRGIMALQVLCCFLACGKPVEKGGSSPQAAIAQKVIPDPLGVFPDLIPRFPTEKAKVFHRAIAKILKPLLERIFRILDLSTGCDRPLIFAPPRFGAIALRETLSKRYRSG